MRHLMAICGALILAAGCGGSGSKAHVDGGADAAGDGGGTPSCTIHFTGGALPDPSLACSTAATFETSSGVTGVSVSGSGQGLDVQFSMDDHGQLGTGDFSDTTPGVDASLTIQSGGDQYTVETGAGSNMGTFTLHVTQIKTQTSDSQSTSYLIDGSLDASAPGSSGTTGTVMVHATFTNI